MLTNCGFVANPAKSTICGEATLFSSVGGTPMYRIARTAGALVAVVALGTVATPAQASNTPQPTASSTVATAVSALPAANLATNFKPKKCGKRQYFRDHRFQCIRYFRYL